MTFIDDDILICRAIFDQIKSFTFKVRIRFAERINMENKSDSRVFPLFLDMIKGYTIFYQSQRKIDEEGFLLAEKEDFNRAKVLFESQIQNVVSKLNDREIKVIDSIYKYPYCEINGIAEDTGMPYQTVRNIIKGRPDRNNIGLLSKVGGLIMKKMLSGETVKTSSERFYVENKTWGEITDFVKFLQ
jgi:transposase